MIFFWTGHQVPREDRHREGDRLHGRTGKITKQFHSLIKKLVISVTLPAFSFCFPQEHMYLEPAGGLAYPTGEKDELQVVAGCQNIMGLQQEIARQDYI